MFKIKSTYIYIYSLYLVYVLFISTMQTYFQRLNDLLTHFTHEKFWSIYLYTKDLFTRPIPKLLNLLKLKMNKLFLRCAAHIIILYVYRSCMYVYECRHDIEKKKREANKYKNKNVLFVYQFSIVIIFFTKRSEFYIMLKRSD